VTLIVITILCVCFIIIIQPIKRQRRAVRAILRTGGKVQYFNERNEDNSPRKPTLLERILGYDVFDTVKYAWLVPPESRESHILDYDDLTMLRDLPRLEYVEIDGGITMDGLKLIADMNNVEGVKLEQPGLDHTAWKALNRHRPNRPMGLWGGGRSKNSVDHPPR